MKLEGLVIDGRTLEDLLVLLVGLSGLLLEALVGEHADLAHGLALLAFLNSLLENA